MAPGSRNSESIAEKLAWTAQMSGQDWTKQGRLFVLRNFTLEPLADWVRYAGYSKNVAIEVSFCDFDAYFRDVLSPDSVIATQRFDVYFVFLLLENIPGANSDDGTVDFSFLHIHLFEILAELRKKVDGRIVLAGLIPPLFMPHDWPGASQLRALNAALEQWSEQTSDVAYLDPSQWLAHFGDDAVDRRHWAKSQMPFTPRALEELGRLVGAHVAQSLGHQVKALVLDADNTLWGGVVGEDGLDGIKLSRNEYPGNCYYSFQRAILSLKQRGIILAICSKNNESDVFDVLENHPDCLIRKSDLAAWRINWDSKDANIKALTLELNIGAESIVFIDDSSFECALVEQALPDVQVLQVPASPSKITTVLNHVSFGASAATEEDKQRTDMYAAERQRKELTKSSISFDGFLESLKLVVRIHPAEEDDIARVTQLFGKTNQFNLTTRRLSETEIRSYSSHPDSRLLVMSVEDKYGPYGLTGVALVRKTEKAVEISDMLLSCRILGRRLEDLLLKKVIEQAREIAPDLPIVASYVPTPKNTQVQDFYDRRGFTLVEKGADGSRHYVLREEDFPDLSMISVED